MADTIRNTDDDLNATTGAAHGNTEPATGHDVGEGGALGAVGGAVVGMLAGGPIGAVIGAVAGGLASAGAVSVVDKHDHDYDRTAGTGGPNDSVIGTAPTHNYTDTTNTGVIGTTTGNAEVLGTNTGSYANTGTTNTGVIGTAPSSYGSNLAQNTGTIASGNETVIPIVEEQIAVGKREVETGGARIRTGVVETPVEQSVSLHEEHVTVSRQPVNQPVSDMGTAFKEQSFEVTETAEEAVVGKQARVVEEVVVGKTATDRVETIHDTVRRTDVEVEDLTSGSTKTGDIKNR